MALKIEWVDDLPRLTNDDNTIGIVMSVEELEDAKDAAGNGRLADFQKRWIKAAPKSQSKIRKLDLKEFQAALENDTGPDGQ